ncbi:MAG: amidohydrolase family protein [Planctomycetota bacterium]
MRNICHYVLLCILFGTLSIGAGAEELIAIKADRLDTVTSGVIENGIIVIADGKIKAIGNDVEIPGTADIIDVPEKTIFPGIVNPSSRIGLSQPARGDPASNPHYRVVDELYPHQDQYKRILGAGFTTLGLLPGEKGFVRYYPGYGFLFGGSPPSTGITGQGAIVRPTGEKPEEMIVAESGFVMIHFQANDKVKKVITSALDSVKNKKSSTDPKVQPLINALQGKVPTFVLCNSPGEILHLLKLLEPYNKMKLVLVEGNETYRVTKELVKKKIPVVLPARIEFESNTRTRINVPRMLAEAEVKIALRPESDSVAGHEDFLRKVAELVKSGLDRQIAKKAITIYPAEMLGIDYRLGSLDVGKDANLLVLSGDPLDIGTKIEKVMIEGKLVHEAPLGETIDE